MKMIELERERILSRLLGSLAVAGSIAYVPSVYFCLVEGLYVLAVIDTVAYAGVLVASLSSRVGYMGKLWTIILACLALGIAVLFNTGAYGAGYVWMIAGLVLSSLFGRARITVATFAFSFAAMAVYGIALWFGYEGHGLTVVSVIVIGTNLFVVCLTIALVIHRIQGVLMRSLEERRNLSSKLAAELAESERIRIELARTLEEKGALVQELHHRVNNNMQLILSLIELENEDCDQSLRIRRRIKVLSAANNVVLWDESASGAYLSDIVRSAVDAAAETGRCVDFADTGSAPRFLDSQTAILISLCIQDLLECDSVGCGEALIEVSDHGSGTRVSLAFGGKIEEADLAAETDRLSRGIPAIAASDIVAYSYIPAARASGPSIVLDVGTE